MVFIAIALLVTAGWYIETQVGEDDEGKPTYHTNLNGYPRVDGSTSAHPLDMLACCYRMHTQWEWREHWDGTYRIFPLYNDPQHDTIREWVDHSGTHGAYINLIENKTDLILVARMPSDSELEWADLMGVDLDIVPVAYDAFVFIVNNECSVNSLTTEQIQKIYQGKISNWSLVGGDPEDIHPYQRDENSGSQELMMDLVMEDLTMINAPDLILMGMMGPINRISYDTCGLGYSVYFFEQFMAPNERLQLVAIDGVTPSYDTIRSGEYPYTTEVYAVIRADTPNEHPSKLTQDWFQSHEGQTVVKMSGYVPVSVI
ncbi:MAG: substrate-binding domain-containing protein [Thermoplasmata archaeon]|nr:substrate-binding domain-containing protein [Thermoplasmata archaeon]MCK5414789.1 substrate-binding domain-containing protein [Thermoplasmata archaeon]